MCDRVSISRIGCPQVVWHCVGVGGGAVRHRSASAPVMVRIRAMAGVSET
jgi:hypothetical protein